MNIKRLRLLMTVLLLMQGTLLLASCSSQAKKYAAKAALIYLEHELNNHK